jgi:hypothetical protein
MPLRELLLISVSVIFISLKSSPACCDCVNLKLISLKLLWTGFLYEGILIFFNSLITDRGMYTSYLAVWPFKLSKRDLMVRAPKHETSTSCRMFLRLHGQSGCASSALRRHWCIDCSRLSIGFPAPRAIYVSDWYMARLLRGRCSKRSLPTQILAPNRLLRQVVIFNLWSTHEPRSREILDHSLAKRSKAHFMNHEWTSCEGPRFQGSSLVKLYRVQIWVT